MDCSIQTATRFEEIYLFERSFTIFAYSLSHDRFGNSETTQIHSHYDDLFSFQATIDPVFNKNPYETAAGFVELSIRLVCMCWFLVELKDTFDHLESAAIKNTTRSGTDSQTENTNQVGGGGGDTAEDTDLDEDDYVVINNGKRYARLDSQSKKTDNNTSGSSYFPDYVSKEERLRSYQKFYLHYGACCLVWFIYLPMLIFVTSFVSELFRLRLVLSKPFFTLSLILTQI